MNRNENAFTSARRSLRKNSSPKGGPKAATNIVIRRRGAGLIPGFGTGLIRGLIQVVPTFVTALYCRQRRPTYKA